VRLLSKAVLGAATTEKSYGGLVGPHLTVLIAFMKGSCHASYSTIRMFVRDCVGVTLARSTLANTINKSARRLMAPMTNCSACCPPRWC